MAWDKVTKIDSIAKRKPYTKANLGKHVEYRDTMKVVAARGHDYASWSCVRGNTIAQGSVTLSKRGRLHRRISTPSGSLSTNWPANHGVR